MRLNEYLLNPEKLDDFVGYAIVILLSIAVFLFWTFIWSKQKVLVAYRERK